MKTHATLVAASILTALAAAPALAGDNTVTQNLSIDWSFDTGLEVGMFDAFDTAGGTRELIGVSASIDANAAWGVTALNYAPTGFEAGEWFADGFANFNMFFGEFDGPNVERIAGGVGFTGLTGNLGAGSGDPIFGQPGDPVVSDTFDGFIGNFFDLDAAEFAVFEGGPVQARLLAFTDATVDGPNGPPGNINIQTDSLTAVGTMTLTYQYRVVPAPAGLALLGALAPIGLRRRR